MTLRGFRHAARRGRGRVLLAIALGLAAGASSLAVPWLAGDGLSRLVEGGTGFFAIVGAIVAALLLRLTLEFGSVLLTGIERLRLVESLRREWHARILAVPPGAERDSRRQEWVSILTYDVPRVAEVFVDVPVSLAQAVFTLGGAFVAMAILSPTLTLIVGALAVPGYFAARWIAGKMRGLAIDYWDLEVDAVALAEESFRARRLIQSFGQQGRWQQAFSDRATGARDAGIAYLRLFALLGPATQFATFVGIAGIVVVGTTFLQVSLEPGQLLTFILYGLLLSQPLRSLANGWSTYQEAEGTLGRFDAVPEPAVHGEVDELPDDLTLTIADVHFAWTDEPVLDGATVTIHPGEHVAIMGANGAGKSTLVSLLLGFARPRHGALAVGNTPLGSLTRTARSRLFSVVHQDVLLVEGTIRDNVAFGAPDATDSEIRDALEVALGRDFVDALPDGLDTRVEEEGRNYSGGQRQRLSVARALLVGAPVMIFDEAASSYDPEARQELVARCREQLSGTTVIWITHHEDPLRHVDRVMHLREGRFSGVSPVVHNAG